MRACVRACVRACASGVVLRGCLLHAGSFVHTGTPHSLTHDAAAAAAAAAALCCCCRRFSCACVCTGHKRIVSSDFSVDSSKQPAHHQGGPEGSPGGNGTDGYDYFSKTSSYSFGVM